MQQTLSKAREFFSLGLYGQALREVVVFLFAVDSIGSVFSRGLIWCGIALAILVGVDTYDKQHGEAVGLKSTLGAFLFFMGLGGVLMYLLFGFAPYVQT